jgi:hypothetical protein
MIVIHKMGLFCRIHVPLCVECKGHQRSSDRTDGLFGKRDKVLRMKEMDL